MTSPVNPASAHIVAASFRRAPTRPGTVRMHGAGVAVGPGLEVGLGLGVGGAVGVGVESGVPAVDRPPAGPPATSRGVEPPPGDGGVAAVPVPGDGDPAPGSNGDPSVAVPGVPTIPATSPRNGGTPRLSDATTMMTITRDAAAASGTAMRHPPRFVPPAIAGGRPRSGSGSDTGATACLPAGPAERAGSPIPGPSRDRSAENAPSALPHAGHAPADRAQHRPHAWMSQAGHVRRPLRSRESVGRAGLPHRSQKRSSRPSADRVSQGEITAVTPDRGCATNPSTAVRRALRGSRAHRSPVPPARCCRARRHGTPVGAARQRRRRPYGVAAAGA